MLIEQFKAREQEAGASGLPLITISQTGKIVPDSDLLHGRLTEQLVTPFTVRRFIGALGILRAGTTITASAA